MIYKVKVAVIGDYGVGKTTLLNTLQNKKEYLAHSTLGVDFLLQNFTHEDKTYKFHIWDTAGQERFRAIVKSYFRDLDVAILVFDVTDYYGLENLDKWLLDLDYINQNKECLKILVGNKIDSADRFILKEDCLKKAKELGFEYFETSRCDRESVLILFQKIVSMVAERHSSKSLELTKHYESRDFENEWNKKIKKKKMGCCLIL